MVIPGSQYIFASKYKHFGFFACMNVRIYAFIDPGMTVNA